MRCARNTRCVNWGKVRSAASSFASNSICALRRAKSAASHLTAKNIFADVETTRDARARQRTTCQLRNCFGTLVRRFSPHRHDLAGVGRAAITSPSGHELAALGEQVSATIGCLGLTDDAMRQRHFADFVRKTGGLRCPVPEGRTEPVYGNPCLHSAEQHCHCHRRQGRLGLGAGEYVRLAAQYSHLADDLDRAWTKRHPVLAAAFHALGGDDP